MTTVVWDGNLLAADTRSTMIKPDGSRIYSDYRYKIWMPVDVVIGIPIAPWKQSDVLAMACAGKWGRIEALKQMLLDQSVDLVQYLNRSACLNDGDLEQGIIVCKDYIVSFGKYGMGMAKVKAYPNDQTIKLSMGSGSPYAAKKMRMGFSAIDAVKHAALNDPGTGGDIQVFDRRYPGQITTVPNRHCKEKEHA